MFTYNYYYNSKYGSFITVYLSPQAFFIDKCIAV